MRRFKWRLTLSLLSLVAAILLSMLGVHQSKSFRHHDGFIVPTAQQISNCMNAPAFLFSNRLANTDFWRQHIEDTPLGRYVFFGVAVSFYFCLFLLWWWVGWRVDLVSEPKTFGYAALLGHSAGLLVSVVLLYVGIHLFRVNFPDIRLIWWPALLPLSTIVWSIALLFYFVKQLVLLRNTMSGTLSQ